MCVSQPPQTQVLNARGYSGYSIPPQGMRAYRRPLQDCPKAKALAAQRAHGQLPRGRVALYMTGSAFGLAHLCGMRHRRESSPECMAVHAAQSDPIQSNPIQSNPSQHAQSTAASCMHPLRPGTEKPSALAFVRFAVQLWCAGGRCHVGAQWAAPAQLPDERELVRQELASVRQRAATRRDHGADESL